MAKIVSLNELGHECFSTCLVKEGFEVICEVLPHYGIGNMVWACELLESMKDTRRDDRICEEK